MDDKGNVVDFNERRSAKEYPDAEFVRQDEYGRKLYLFLTSYDLGSDQYGSELWAYDLEDARKKVSAMRESLRIDGMAFASVPA